MTPASCRIPAITCAECGAISEGFSTIVQPAASAGATLQAIWLAGQFHGVISPQTPTGSRTTMVEPSIRSNLNSFSTFSATMKWPRPAGPCIGSATLAYGAPISSLIACARSPMRFWYTSRMRPSSAMRSSRVVREYVSNARCAAATARSTSAREPSEITPVTASVAGLTTSSVCGWAASTHCPSM